MGALNEDRFYETGAPGCRPGIVTTLLRTAVGAWLAAIVLGLGMIVVHKELSLVPLGSTASIFVPWTIDGPWSLLADAGWIVVASVVMCPIVHFYLSGRDRFAPTRFWTIVALSIGGAGGLLVGGTTSARYLLALVLISALVVGLGHVADGSPRPTPIRVTRLGAAGAVLLLAVLVLPFSLTHPLAIQNASLDQSGPGGGEFNTGDILLTGRQSVDATVEFTGLSHVTTGAFEGTGLDEFEVRHRYVAGGELAATFRLRRCTHSRATITAVRIGYRRYGINWTQTLGIDNPQPIFCQSRP